LLKNITDAGTVNFQFTLVPQVFGSTLNTLSTSRAMH